MTNFTRPRELDGEYNFVAGVGLINASRLIKWDKSAAKFVMPSPGDESFENVWNALDPQLGRVILWNAFSNGAEYLFKGLLMANNIEGVRGLGTPKPVQPTEAQLADVNTWAKAFVAKDSAVYKPLKQANYYSLGSAMEAPWIALQKKRMNTHRRGSAQHSNLKREANLIEAAYVILRDTIRNRDTHAYIPNVREDHRYLCEALFLPAFNLVVQWMPDQSSVTAMMSHRNNFSSAEAPVSPWGTFPA